MTAVFGLLWAALRGIQEALHEKRDKERRRALAVAALERIHSARMALEVLDDPDEDGPDILEALDIGAAEEAAYREDRERTAEARRAAYLEHRALQRRRQVRLLDGDPEDIPEGYTVITADGISEGREC